MKGVFALAALALLAGCSSMNMFNKAEPADKWTTWPCDSKAEVNWRFANPARTEVDVRRVGCEPETAITIQQHKAQPFDLQ